MIIVFQDVDFSHRELPIENIEKFPFNATDVTSTEHPGTQGPVVVLNRPVVNVLRVSRVEFTVNVAEGAMKSNTDFIGKNERPQEDSLAGPLRRLDKEVVLGPLDIHQGHQHRGYLNFGAVDHI